MRRFDKIAVRVGFMLLALVLVPVAAVRANTPGVTDPLAKLNIWEGHWTVQIHYLETPFSHSGTAAYHGDCSWLRFHSFMLCDFTFDTPGTASNDALVLLSYSAKEKSYKHVEMGRELEPKMMSFMTVDGNVWKIPFDMQYNGKTVLGRDTYTFASPNKFLFTFEMSVDGGKNWVLVMRQVGTKV